MAQQTHRKLKNTGILFELLVRQIASDTITGQKSAAFEIIKKYFNNKSELSKELQLYKTLLEDKFKDKHEAENFLRLVLDNRKTLDEDKLNREKYELIASLKEHYDLDKFFKTRINNYKEIASIYKLFNSGKNRPAEIVRSKYTILENIMSTRINKQDQKDEILEEYKKMDKDIRLLAYKMLLEKFNNKYSTELLPKQKQLLRQYLNNVSDSVSLKEYVDKELPIIIEDIENLKSNIDDEIMVIKIDKIKKYIPSIFKGSILSENQMLQLMNFYALIDEMKKIKE